MLPTGAFRSGAAGASLVTSAMSTLHMSSDGYARPGGLDHATRKPSWQTLGHEGARRVGGSRQPGRGAAALGFHPQVRIGVGLGGSFQGAESQRHATTVFMQYTH